MAALPIAELIGRSYALFGVPHHVAKGALSGHTAALDPAEAQQIINAWLETPTVTAQTPAPRPPDHVAIVAVDPLGEEGQIPVVRSGEVVWQDAPTGTGGTATLNYRGAWDSATSYASGDVVTLGGSSYLALQGSTNNNPTTSPTKWGVLAAKGADGAQGAQGPAGATGPQGPAGAAGRSAVTVVTSPGDPTPNVANYADGDLWIQTLA